MKNVNEKVQVVILAAGNGTRMGSEMPKVLVELGGRPMICRLLDSLREAEICDEPIIVVSPSGKNMVMKATGEYGCRYVVQKEQLGTGHALAAARELVEDEKERIVCLYGDHPLIKAASLEKIAREKDGVISIVTTKLPDFEDWRVAFQHWGRIVRSQGEIEKIVEYKDASEEIRKITEVNSGIYSFDNEWLWKNIDQLRNENAQKEYYLTDMVNLAWREGKKVASLTIDSQEVVGINSPEELRIAESLI